MCVEISALEQKYILLICQHSKALHPAKYVWMYKVWERSNEIKRGSTASGTRKRHFPCAWSRCLCLYYSNKLYPVKCALLYSSYIQYKLIITNVILTSLFEVFYFILKTLQYSGWMMVYFWPFYRSELFMLRRLWSLTECGVGIWPTCSPQRQPARDLPVLSADSVSQGPPIQKAIWVNLCKHTRRRSWKNV